MILEPVIHQEYVSVDGLSDLLACRQSQADSGGVHGERKIQSAKHLEDFLPVFLLDTNSSISHDELKHGSAVSFR